MEDDDIHEEQESFTVQITTNDRAVILGADTASMFITDNDGEWFSFG